jgi:hypothetical protein
METIHPFPPPGGVTVPTVVYQIKIYYVHFRPLYSIGHAYRHITQRFRSRTPRRYCHLITLVTSVYRKTNVFLTTAGTVCPYACSVIYMYVGFKSSSELMLYVFIL